MEIMDVNADLAIIANNWHPILKSWCLKNFKLDLCIFLTISVQLVSNQPTIQLSSLTLNIFLFELAKLTLKIYSPISVTCLCDPLLVNNVLKVRRHFKRMDQVDKYATIKLSSKSIWVCNAQYPKWPISAPPPLFVSGCFAMTGLGAILRGGGQWLLSFQRRTVTQ